MRAVDIVTALCAVAASQCALAQIDDLLESAWTQPALDVLEMYREVPMCLRCTNAHALTELPGISQRTASAIAQTATEAHITSLDQLADTLCLSPDVAMILKLCTTLECSCGGFVRSVDARMRVVAHRESAAGRIDGTFLYGRAGAQISFQPSGAATLVGGWLNMSVDGLRVLLGDGAVLMDTGILFGSARGLSRGPTSMLSSANTKTVLRPWTGLDRTGALRGGIAEWTLHTLPINVLAGYGWHTDGKETTPVTFAGAGVTMGGVSARVLYATGTLWKQSANAAAYSVSATGTFASGTWMAELVTSEQGKTSVALLTNAEVGTTDLGVFLWRYDSSIRSVFGSSVGTSSAPENSTGVLLSAQHRVRSVLSVAGALTYRERLTRSYITPLPSHLLDVVAEALLRTSVASTLSMRLRISQQTESASGGLWRMMHETFRWSARVELETALRRSVVLRVRVDMRAAGAATTHAESGILGAIAAHWKPLTNITLRAQWALFSAEAYDAAPYLVSPDVPGVVVPWVANGVGTRRTVMVRWDCFSWATLSAQAFVDSRRNSGASITTTGATLQLDARLRPPAGRRFLAGISDYATLPAD